MSTDFLIRSVRDGDDGVGLDKSADLGIVITCDVIVQAGILIEYLAGVAIGNAEGIAVGDVALITKRIIAVVLN